MKRFPVVSSNIKEVGYDVEGETLLIAFTNGTEYTYPKVSAATFMAVLMAESVGKSFNQLVKAYPDRYPATRIL